MVFQRKSRKLLFISTALMIVGLASVLTVYAAALGTFYGGTVTVNDVTAGGTVTYSTDGGSNWVETPTINVGGTLNARVVITTTYSGQASVSWQLQKDNSGWQNVGSPFVTTLASLASGQQVYASADGTSSSLNNFGASITTGGSYRIVATVSTA